MKEEPKFKDYKEKQKYYKDLSKVKKIFWNSSEKGTYVKPKEVKHE